MTPHDVSLLAKVQQKVDEGVSLDPDRKIMYEILSADMQEEVENWKFKLSLAEAIAKYSWGVVRIPVVPPAHLKIEEDSYVFAVTKFRSMRDPQLSTDKPAEFGEERQQKECDNPKKLSQSHVGELQQKTAKSEGQSQAHNLRFRGIAVTSK